MYFNRFRCTTTTRPRKGLHLSFSPATWKRTYLIFARRVRRSFFHIIFRNIHIWDVLILTVWVEEKKKRIFSMNSYRVRPVFEWRFSVSTCQPRMWTDVSWLVCASVEHAPSFKNEFLQQFAATQAINFRILPTNSPSYTRNVCVFFCKDTDYIFLGQTEPIRCANLNEWKSSKTTGESRMRNINRMKKEKNNIEKKAKKSI